MIAENKNKRQSLRIIISEAIMVLTVIATVTVLALVVSGYWINSDFEVERQGMLQIYSTPTGANVNIDGAPSSWLQRTNTSKVLSSGEHTVALSKEGYDTWSKTVNIREGLLYRLHYPRLFLKNRTPQKLLNTAGTIYATMPSSHDAILLANNTTKWKYINLNSDKLTPSTLDVAKLFSDTNSADSVKAGVFDYEILSADWDYDAAHILLKAKYDTAIEWVLLDVKDIAKSINLTKEFGGDFSDVKILDNSSSNLLVVQNGNLHKIDVSGRLISAVLVKDIKSLDHFNNEIVFSAKSQNTSEDEYYVGYFKIGDDKITSLTTTPDPVKVVFSKFYDKKYFTILDQNKVSIYEKENFQEYNNYDLSFVPHNIEVGRDGEFIFMYDGSKAATIDMEAGNVRGWEIEGESFGWVDNDMLYTVKDGELIVYDFDGLNRRELAKNVSSHFPAGITDNKWLYYFSDDELIREVISN